MGNNQGTIILGVFATAFLIYIGYNLLANISPYTPVSELLELESAYNVQVNGTIENTTVLENNTSIFYLTDGKSKVKVIYDGYLHNQDGLKVVVVGDYKNGTLYAYQILNKCHTEYETGGE
jgi:cytochrome c-type biogenesis protein CcmE